MATDLMGILPLMILSSQAKHVEVKFICLDML